MEDLTYEQFIQQILDSRGRFSCGKEYHERHHIVPRCLGGTDNKNNLIDLFAREHFIAHRLLALETPHDKGLQYAWWCMTHMKSNNNKCYICTPEEYEEVRIAYSKTITGEGNPFYGKTHTEETRMKMRENHAHISGKQHYLYGKHLPESTKQKLRDKMSGVNSPNYGKHYTMPEETKEKLRQSHLGKKASEEARKKMSESRKGEKNHMFGKKHSLETCKKISKNHADVKGKNNPRSIPVVCVETGELFWGAKEAQNVLGINKASIAKCCKGKQKTAGGYHWKYADADEIEN